MQHLCYYNSQKLVTKIRQRNMLPLQSKEIINVSVQIIRATIKVLLYQSFLLR